MERTAWEIEKQIDRDRFRSRLLKYTRKAFKLLPEVDKPHVLDVGCGSGTVTIELARLSSGRVVGIDTDQASLDTLNRKIVREGLPDRVETKRCSMLELRFPAESFDIIWVEGAIQAIGFEEGVQKWRRLLKPKGYLVLHDEIRAVSGSLEKTSSFGYRLINQFLLPNRAWWVDYYRPLEGRVRELREEYKGNFRALRMLEKVQKEIDVVKRNPEDYHTAFYILQKKESQ